MGQYSILMHFCKRSKLDFTYSVDEDHFSGLHLSPHDERLIGREIGGAEGSSLRETQSLIKREDEHALGHDVLGVLESFKGYIRLK